MNAALSAALVSDLKTFNALAHQWDPLGDRTLLVRLSSAECRAAAFLDQRLLTAATVGVWMGWSEFGRAAQSMPDRTPPMIFHVGHCGSTLLSKLVEAASGAAGMREPLVLRTIAAEYGDAASGDSLFETRALDERLRIFLKTCARDGGASVLKASSMCGDLMAPVLGSDQNARAVFVHIRPEKYIAAMLGGENNRMDLRGFAKLRRQRLARRGVDCPPLHALSAGEVAALCWLAEATAFAAAANSAAGRIAAVDFDEFLKAPGDGLSALCRRLNVDAGPEAIDAAVCGPTMKSYSKAQEYAFDASDRAALIAQYAAENRAEVAKGDAFIEAAAKRSALVAEALSRLA